MDAAIGKRNILNQLPLNTMLTAPLNVMTHCGTPAWLQKQLSDSGIIRNPSKKLFLNVDRLRNALPIIKQEALASLKDSKPINKDLFFRGIADNGWKRFYIKWYGPSDSLAKSICPQTCALLDSMPEVHLAMFSILMPGSKITRHFGPARMCLRYHMGLFTPNDDDCFINLNGEKYSWRDDEDVMFDDTLIHFVENNTDKPRIILFLDIERPQVNGVLKQITKAQIKYGGPLTTRSNEKNEKVQKELLP
jgi:beta-hydroxylase